MRQYSFCGCIFLRKGEVVSTMGGCLNQEHLEEVSLRYAMQNALMVDADAAILGWPANVHLELADPLIFFFKTAGIEVIAHITFPASRKIK